MLDHLLSRFTRLLSTISGRDKVMRLLQYYACFRIWHLTENRGSTQQKQVWNMVMRQLALTRKMLRVGKSVEHIQIAVNMIATAKQQGDFLSCVALLRQLLSATYLSLDSITVLDSLGVRPWKAAPRIQSEASRVWVSLVLCGLIKQLYCCYRLIRDRCSSHSSVHAKNEDAAR